MHEDVQDAGSIAEETSVTPRFTLKILHKLVKGRLVISYKGAHGGYKLATAPESITLKSVIELIEGPIAIARCVDSSGACSLNHDKTACIYHHIFDNISMEIAEKLERITIKDVIDKTKLRR